MNLLTHFTHVPGQESLLLTSKTTLVLLGLFTKVAFNKQELRNSAGLQGNDTSTLHRSLPSPAERCYIPMGR